MTTNEIEKQLKLKAEKQIHQCVADVVDKIRGFGNTHTGVNRSGMVERKAKDLLNKIDLLG